MYDKTSECDKKNYISS